MTTANPQGWQDIHACDCGACRALTSIHRRCIDSGEPLFVQDCRMFGRGFRVADVRKLFVEPATEGPDFQEALWAIDYVRARQEHCDVFFSSWPLKPAGHRDYIWQALCSPQPLELV